MLKDDLEKLKIEIISSNNLTEEKKLEILQKIDNGQYFDFRCGYATIDRPWGKYYNQDELYKERPKRTVYQEVYDNNKKNTSDLAIEFFGTKINYAEFFNNIEKTAKSFEEYGIKEGSFVTICAAGIPETAYSFYAASKIGAVVNMISPYFDKDDLIDRIEDCESDVLIVMDTFYGDLKDAIKRSRIKNIIVLPTLNSSLLRLVGKKIKLEKYSNELFWNQFIKDGSKRRNTITIDYKKDIPLAMVYSSGTTGASKGILLSNDSFQNSIQAYPASGVDISRHQKFYQIIPPWFSTGLSTSLHLPLSYGVSVFMDPRFERSVFVKNVLKAKPNYAVAPTSMYEGFLDESLIKNKDLSFFNYPFEGGEPLSVETAENIEKVFREHGNHSTLRVAYGQCEAGAAIATQTQKIKHSEGSVGIPLPGITLAIVDEEFNELTYGNRGQILANTPCRMLEYFKNEEETKKYFYIDKYGNKWNCTGDIGYVDENGELFVQGRATDYTIINGRKIYNFDVENVVSSYDGVKLCDVLEKTDEYGNSKLAVHIIFEDELNAKLKLDKNLLEQVLFDIQNDIYNKFKDLDMVPKIFKIRDDFPYAKSGKRDVAKIKSETDNFIYLDNDELIKQVNFTKKKK